MRWEHQIIAMPYVIVRCIINKCTANELSNNKTKKTICFKLIVFSLLNVDFALFLFEFGISLLRLLISFIMINDIIRIKHLRLCS